MHRVACRTRRWSVARERLGGLPSTRRRRGSVRGRATKPGQRRTCDQHDCRNPFRFHNALPRLFNGCAMNAAAVPDRGTARQQAPSGPPERSPKAASPRLCHTSVQLVPNHTCHFRILRVWRRRCLSQPHRRRSALEKVCELGLEGVVAKKRSGHYLPGRRGWIKTKNRAYWRYPLELAAARSYSADR